VRVYVCTRTCVEVSEWGWVCVREREEREHSVGHLSSSASPGWKDGVENVFCLASRGLLDGWQLLLCCCLLSFLLCSLPLLVFRCRHEHGGVVLDKGVDGGLRCGG